MSAVTDMKSEVCGNMMKNPIFSAVAAIKSEVSGNMTKNPILFGAADMLGKVRRSGDSERQKSKLEKYPHRVVDGCKKRCQKFKRLRRGGGGRGEGERKRRWGWSCD